MRTGRPKAELVLSKQQRAQLQSFARSRSVPAAPRTINDERVAHLKVGMAPCRLRVLVPEDVADGRQIDPGPLRLAGRRVPLRAERHVVEPLESIARTTSLAG
jgi:putative transposase